MIIPESAYLNFGLESCRQLVQNFVHQLLVFQNFSGLHNSDNGSLDEQLAILFDVLVRHLDLDLLLRLHRDVDVHAQLLVLVAVKEANHVPVFKVVLVCAFVLKNKQLGLEQDLQHLQMMKILALNVQLLSFTTPVA